MNYMEFLERKRIESPPAGLDGPFTVTSHAFEFQRDIVEWALRRGRAAIFADCGMGKTLMQLAWAANVPGDVLILAPLSVAQQTVREGVKFGVDVQYCRDKTEINNRIVITNYEMLNHFDTSRFNAIILDESSILKSYTGKFRNQIIESFTQTPYRLACTATPAPNDFMELGNHAEFLGVMSRTEMLSMFFVHDGGETQKWRIKGHAEEPFWKWICSWAVMIGKPSDLGYEDCGFTLPPLEIHQHTVESSKPMEGFLFPMEAQTLQERQQARRESTDDRVVKCAEIIGGGQWLIWCNMNDESSKLTKIIPGAVEVKGADSVDHKEKSILGFINGDVKVLVTKPSIAGFGMNLQNCSNMAFVGLSDSYEQFYQAVRRCWRFGQKSPVNVHVITAAAEGAVVKNIQRKEIDAKRMREEMVKHMAIYNTENIKSNTRTSTGYNPSLSIQLPEFIRR